MRDLFHPKRSDIELTAVMHALSDPTRLDIVRQLADGEEQACGNFGVGVAKSTLSQHFKVLRDSGVIRTRVDGTTRWQTLRRDDLDARFPGLLDAILGADRRGRRVRVGARRRPDGLGRVTSWRRLGTSAATWERSHLHSGGTPRGCGGPIRVPGCRSLVGAPQAPDDTQTGACACDTRVSRAQGTGLRKAVGRWPVWMRAGQAARVGRPPARPWLPRPLR